jgi:hypothetical protein
MPSPPLVRRHVALALAVLSLVVLAAPATRAADSGAGCGRPKATKPWRGDHSCHFWFRGFPITVMGDASGPTGKARVRVWVSTEDAPDVALVECSASDPDGNGFARCSNGLPDETTSFPYPTAAQFLTLRCHVEGASEGTYWCSSGTGA